LPVILAVATILRLYHLDFSFSNDELSALSRLRFDNFNDLIWKGVGEDFHPAFVQLMLYIWSNLFGISEWITRMPFVIFGVCSVYLVYKLGLELFDENTALLSAAATSSLSFFILYSQLARPYSPGLFFTLLAAYGWVKIIKGPPSHASLLTAGVATALAMYTHYFSFMTVGIIWLSVLPMLNQFNRKDFFKATFLAGLLFLPHIKITLLQLSYGGVGTWLGAPENDFWIDFMSYIFNSSNVLLIIYLLLVFGIATYNRKNLVLNQWQLFCAIVFLTPMIIGYYYSIHVNPVLQYSTLLFCTPFLFVLIFSFVSRLQGLWLTSLLISAILLINTYSTVFDKKFFEVEHFGVFKELTEKIVEWDMKYGPENVSYAANVNGDYYLEYYFDQQNHAPNFVTYNTQSDSSLAHLQYIIQQSTTPYFAFCWSTVGTSAETFEVIRSRYPTMISSINHFNSGAYLFGRGLDERKPVFSSGNLLTSKASWLNTDSSMVFDSSTENFQYLLAPNDEFVLTFEALAKEIGAKSNDLLVVQASISTNPQTKVELVLDIEQKNGTRVWHGKKLFNSDLKTENKTNEIILARNLPANLAFDDKLKIYLWKTSRDTVFIDNYEIQVFSAHRLSQ
jgi:hypothetical protein